MKNYPVVYVEWDDAVSAPAGWIDDIDEWLKSSEYIIRETGFLLKEDKRAIYLAGFWKPEDGQTIERFGNVRRIPKGIIIKKIYLNNENHQTKRKNNL